MFRSKLTHTAIKIAALRACDFEPIALDELIAVFLKRSIEQKDVPAGMLVVKALERKSLLLGLDQPTKFDVVQVTAKEATAELRSHSRGAVSRR